MKIYRPKRLTYVCTILFLLFFSVAALAQRPFITKWKTDNPGEKIIIPINSEVTGYNYSVDWGDGTSSTGQTATVEHTYSSAGTYTVSVNGSFPAIRLQNVSSEIKDRLMSIDSWGDVVWKSMYGAFSGARNMVLNATDKPNLGAVSSLERMFFGAEAFNGDLSSWDVSGITNMSNTFYNAFDFNGNISNWNVSNVTNMQGMFWNASTFNQDISGWNVMKVQDMSFMFYQASIFNQDLSGWNVSQVTTMNSMFFVALAFDRSLGNWNISGVTDMENMLRATGLSSANYGATLIGWAARPVQANVKLTATGQTYCTGSAATTARQQLIGKGWQISDDGAITCNVGGVITPGDPSNFITTWKTDNPGVSNSNQITIPTRDGGYNYAIYWEEVGNSGNNGTQSGITGSHTITFPSVGSYKVEIKGDFPRIYFDNTGDKEKILSVEQWGTIQWGSMDKAFYGAKNLQVNTTVSPDLSQVRRMEFMFSRAEGFNQNLSNWDVSKIENMVGMFQGAKSFNSPLDGWKPGISVAGGCNLDNMFLGTEVFNQDLSSWDVSNVNRMSAMFQGAKSFNSPLNGWKPGISVVGGCNLSNMFLGTEVFNQDLSSWDVSNANSMGAMFENTKAFNSALNNWKPGINVTDGCNLDNMFLSTEVFNQDLSSWDVSKIRSMVGMFHGTKSFNSSLNGWKPGISVAGGCNLSNMFLNAEVFNQDLSSWDVSKIRSMGRMFQEAKSFNSPLNSWKPGISIAGGCNLSNMFSSVQVFNRDLSSWDVSNVNSMGAMFENTKAFNGTLNNWKPGINVTGGCNLEHMFKNAEVFNQDLSSWDVSNANNMWAMFENTKAFNSALNNWKPGKSVVGGCNLNNMFLGTVVFNQDLSSWDVSNVNSMGAMFEKAKVFNSPLIGWKPGKSVVGGCSLNNMFLSATVFNQDLSSWDISSVIRMSNMLNNSGLSVANYDATLLGWSSQSNVPQNITLGATGLKYCQSKTARQSLIVSNHWTIADAGEDCVVLNNPPVANDDQVSVTEDIPATGNVLTNDSDPEVNTLTASLVVAPVNGTVVLNADGSFTYTPNSNYNGRDSLRYQVCDNGTPTLCDTAWVHFTVAGVNDSPIALDDQVNVNEDTPATGNVLINDSDPDGNALTASLVTAPVNGTIVLNANGSFTYTPNSNYSGPDSLRYQVCDNGTPTLCNTAWVHFTVLEVNKAPTDIQLSNITVVQSAGVNGLVGSLSTVDPDLQDTHSYTLVAGGVDNAKFNVFNNNGNWVLRASNPGIMPPQTYAIRIRTTDNNNKFFEKAFTITVVDDIAPVVTSVAVPANGYYREGDPLEFAVNFSEDVIVGGTPYIPITIGSTVRMVQYSTGLGTNQLVFSYTVQAGEVDMDGVALGTAIHLNGGTIRDAAQNNAVLTLQSIAPTNNVLVNAVRPTVVLSTAMTLVNTPFSVTATFSEAVTGFSVADITASNTTISNLQTANNITYSFLVTPTTGGLVQLSLPEYVAVNIAGNGNTASNILNVQYNKVISGISFENGSFVYDGAVKSLAVTGTLPFGTTVSYQNNSRTDVGTQEVTATISGANYEDLVLKADLTINKAEISGITLTDGSFVYNGTVRSLAITGTLPTGTTVSYQNNSRTDVGTQEVTAMVSGANYEDLVLKADLTITKAEISGITLNDGSFVYDGTARSLAITGTLPTGTTVSYQNNSRTDVGTQEVTATVSGRNYEDLVLQADLTINKAVITGVTLSDGSFVYNGTARSLAITGTLPTGTTVSYQSNSRTDVGTQEVTATVSGANYEDLVLKADLTINKAVITGVTLSDGSFVYDGTLRSLAITGTLPQGTSVTYTNNGKTDAGIYTVTATIDGGINYNSIVRTATLTIHKATLNHLTLSDAQYVYDGTAKSLQVAGAIPSGLEILYVNNAKINSGIYEVTAVIEPSTNYEGISLAATLQIKKAAQVITFNSPGTLGRDAGTVPLDVSASSNLPIRLTVNEPLIATVSGTDLQVHRLGTVTVTAIQEGDANHEAAEAVSLKVRIAAAADAKLPVRVHQAVSPNGDGINEFLMIEGIGNYLDNKVTIFDKSGRVLQEIEGYNNRDQVFTGEYHRDGTYYYYLDVKDGTQWKREKGFFVIRR